MCTGLLLLLFIYKTGFLFSLIHVYILYGTILSRKRLYFSGDDSSSEESFIHKIHTKTLFKENQRCIQIQSIDKFYFLFTNCS